MLHLWASVIHKNVAQDQSFKSENRNLALSVVVLENPQQLEYI